ncbi:MAG: hypothetical protein ABIC39_04450 [Pseudomonadota bacterium]
MQSLIDFAGTHIPQIAGTLITAAIVAYLAGLNNRLNRLAVASANFRNVFLTELKGLYPIPSDWPEGVNGIDHHLKTAFPNLQTAVTEFRHFVPWYRRLCFDRAWRLYRLGKDGREIDQQDYWQYIPHSGRSVHEGKEIAFDNTTFDNTKIYKENFHRNIKRLLKYAKQI